MKRLIAVALLAVACVAPAQAGAPSGDCVMTAQAHDTPSGRQITVTGAQFTANEPITLGGSTPDGTITAEFAANDQGNFSVELAAEQDGRYIVGPATGQVCVAPAVTVLLATPVPTSKPTPRPAVTMPPTDTE